MSVTSLDKFIIFFKPLFNPTPIPIPTNKLGTQLTISRLDFLKAKCKSFLEWECIPIIVPMIVNKAYIGYETGANAAVIETTIHKDAFKSKSSLAGLNTSVANPGSLLSGATKEPFLVAKKGSGFTRNYTFTLHNSTTTNVIVSVLELLLTTNIRLGGQSKIRSSQRTAIKAFVFDGFTIPDFLTVISYGKNVDADGNGVLTIELGIPEIIGGDEEQEGTGISGTSVTNGDFALAYGSAIGAG